MPFPHLLSAFVADSLPLLVPKEQPGAPQFNNGATHRSISIVFVITGIGWGGAEGMLYRLLSGLDRTRFTATVITLIDVGPQPLIDKIQALGIPVRCLGMRPGRPSLVSLLKLIHWLRKDSPDLISTWQYHADLIGGLAGRLAGRIPVAWGIRQSDLSREGNGRLTVLTVKVCALLSRWLPGRIICCSEASRLAHEKYGYAAEQMVVIPNGYDLEVFRPDEAARLAVRKAFQVSEHSPIIGLVGRFHPQKDHRNFISAAGLLHKDRPDVYFILCGLDVDWENKTLTSWIEEAGIGKSVFLLGRREDIPQLTAALDVACLSSFSEGFPNVVSEAMSCEVPCVVTDVGEAATIVGHTGLVVPPRDSMALAVALRTMIDLGRDGRSRLGKAARQRIKERFDLPQVVSRYESLFLDLADHAG